jgi:serine/threonine protein kinase
MSIARGSRLGAYEIVAHLGAGGMGEVYRAKDAKQAGPPSPGIMVLLNWRDGLESSVPNR